MELNESETKTELTPEQSIIQALTERLDKTELALKNNLEATQKIQSFLDTDLPGEMGKIVNAVKARFEDLEKRIVGTSPQSDGGIMGIIKDGMKLLQGAGGGSSSDTWVKEINSIVHENVSDTFKLVQMDLKDMLSYRRGMVKQSAVPVVPDHVVLEGKT